MATLQETISFFTMILTLAYTAIASSGPGPVFVECESPESCSFTTGLTGSFTCVIYEVQRYDRLNVTVDNPNVGIVYQEKEIVTTNDVTNVTLTSRYEVASSHCGESAVVTCQLVTESTVQTNYSTVLEIEIQNCDAPLSLEEKVWLGAITVFPFLWLFTVIIVVNMNRESISDFLCQRRHFKLKNSLVIGTRRLKELDGKHNRELYVYFVDQKSCIAVSEEEPTRSLQLIVEKHIPLSRKSERRNNPPRPVREFELQQRHPVQPTNSSSTREEHNQQQADRLVHQISGTAASNAKADGPPHAVIDVSISDVEDDTSLEENNEHNVSADQSCTRVDIEGGEEGVLPDQTNEHVVREDNSLLSPAKIHAVLQWCRCGDCQETSTTRERICCRRTFGECVTEDPLFEQLVLDLTTLEAAMAHVYDLKDLRVGPDNSEYRKAAFKEYVCWQIGPTQKFSRVIIPSCVVRQIRSRYPSEDDYYKGFVLPTRFERTCY